MELHKHITAFLLAGGKSTRMGTDKGMALLHGKEMAVHMTTLLQKVFQDVIIIANHPDYSAFHLPVYDDLLIDKGPLGGIYTGLTYSNTPWNFFIACDMPYMRSEIIESLSGHLNDQDVVVPFNQNRFEPLCAFYNKSCMRIIENQLEQEDYSLQKLISLLNYKSIDVQNYFKQEGDPFLNINTKEELSRYNKL